MKHLKMAISDGLNPLSAWAARQHVTALTRDIALQYVECRRHGDLDRRFIGQIEIVNRQLHGNGVRCLAILRNHNVPRIGSRRGTFWYVNIAPDALVLSRRNTECGDQLERYQDVRIILVVIRPVGPQAQPNAIGDPGALEAHRRLALIALVVSKVAQALDLQIPLVEQFDGSSHPAKHVVASGRVWMDRRAVRSHQRIETDGYICSRVVCGLQHEIEADSLIPSTKQRNFGAVPSAIDDLPGEILFVESCPE